MLPEAGKRTACFLDRLPEREFRRETLPPPDRRIARVNQANKEAILATNAKRFYGTA